MPGKKWLENDPKRKRFSIPSCFFSSEFKWHFDLEFTAIESTRCEHENESNFEHTLEEAIEATSECNFKKYV